MVISLFRVAAGTSLAILFVTTSSARAEDLTTLSGVTYHDVHPLRVEADGVIWQHAGGIVKVDFANSPETVRRAYNYDPAKAAAYRAEEDRIREQSAAQAQRDAKEHAAHQQARIQASIAQAGAGTDAATVFRRAMSPAASDGTREMAAQMREDAENKAAANAANPDQLHLIPVVPSALGARPVNGFMDTPNTKEYAAALGHAPTGAGDVAVPAAALKNTSIQDGIFEPLYTTRSYYEDVDRAEAFARGVPLKP